MVKHFVYVIVDSKTRKLLAEQAFDNYSKADLHLHYLLKDTKTKISAEILELRVFK